MDECITIFISLDHLGLRIESVINSNLDSNNFIIRIMFDSKSDDKFGRGLEDDIQNIWISIHLQLNSSDFDSFLMDFDTFSITVERRNPNVRILAPVKRPNFFVFDYQTEISVQNRNFFVRILDIPLA